MLEPLPIPFSRVHRDLVRNLPAGENKQILLTRVHSATVALPEAFFFVCQHLLKFSLSLVTLLACVSSFWSTYPWMGWAYISHFLRCVEGEHILMYL